MILALPGASRIIRPLDLPASLRRH